MVGVDGVGEIVNVEECLMCSCDWDMMKNQDLALDIRGSNPSFPANIFLFWWEGIFLKYTSQYKKAAG